ncbi:hypothetical protein [Nocardiopsis synnemataformans]|uniref:hypothetical protein n=1 Tax=Nocardiopsis synnemataformans TaxID=61305 RepID=UPI003EB6981B
MMVAVFSLSGAPGVTTLSLALASTWPAPGMARVVEADASGGDVAAWWRLAPWPGVVDLAAASRSGQDHETLDLGSFSQVLPGGLRVCVAPPTAERTTGAVGVLAHNPKALTETVVDLGRVAPSTPSASLLEAADVAVLVTTGDVAHLKRVKESAPGLRSRCAHVGVAVVGADRSAAEISGAVGLPVWARVPHDPRTAAFLWGQGEVRRVNRRPLITAARTLAHALEEQGRTESSSSASALAAEVP